MRQAYLHDPLAGSFSFLEILRVREGHFESKSIGCNF